jgi:peroxiredoxin
VRLASIAVVVLLAAHAVCAKPAPDFTLKTLDGRAVRLEDLRGKVVLLNFWATWCAACRVEMPRFVEQYRKHHAQGLEIVGVSMDDAGNDAVAAFVAAHHINYTIVRGNDAVAKAYGGVRFLPQTFVIDRKGEIVRTIVGPPEERELDELIERAR